MDEQAEFDKQEQVEVIQAHLIPGETLHAVCNCHGVATGFVGFTDRRLIFHLPSFLGVRAKTLISLPYWHVGSVGSLGASLMGPSKIVIGTTSGEQYEFGFRTEDRSSKAYTLIMTHVIERPD